MLRSSYSVLHTFEGLDKARERDIGVAGNVWLELSWHVARVPDVVLHERCVAAQQVNGVLGWRRWGTAHVRGSTTT